MLWLALIGVSTGLGLLAAWPMAILIDSVLSTSGGQDWIHRLFLAPLPSTQVGRVIGLAIIGLLLKLAQEALSIGQTIVSNHVNYSGLVRVRCDLYRNLQALHLAYHRSQPQGDAIYRLSTDTFACRTILGVLVNPIVAAVTLVTMTIILGTRSLPLTLIAFSI